jgi:hypothetical protein
VPDRKKGVMFTQKQRIRFAVDRRERTSIVASPSPNVASDRMEDLNRGRRRRKSETAVQPSKRWDSAEGGNTGVTRGRKPSERVTRFPGAMIGVGDGPGK